MAWAAALRAAVELLSMECTLATCVRTRLAQRTSGAFWSNLLVERAGAARGFAQVLNHRRPQTLEPTHAQRLGQPRHGGGCHARSLRRLAHGLQTQSRRVFTHPARRPLQLGAQGLEVAVDQLGELVQGQIRGA